MSTDEMTAEQALAILKQPDRIGCNLIKANDEESNKYNQETIEALNTAFKALEIVKEFERAQIITGGRLNGRTYAYKCGLEDGKRKALEQQPSDDCVSREQAVKTVLDWYFDLLEGNETKDIVNLLDALPPVTPTHGTCKDCVNHGINKEHTDIDGARYCSSFRTYTGYDFYCADFEKRGDLDGSN